MPPKENQIRVINLLAKHEKMIGELYDTYAENFPKYRDFWMTLSGEEDVHAKLITELTEKMKEKEAYFNEGRFREGAIKTSMDHIKEEMQEVKDGVSLIEALSVTYHLESALLEKKYFEIFEGDSAKLKSVLKRLSEETAEHKKRVEPLLNKEREKKGIK